MLYLLVLLISLAPLLLSLSRENLTYSLNQSVFVHAIGVIFAACGLLL